MTEQSKIENPKWLRLSVIAFVLVAAVAEAQQPARIPKVGVLEPTAAGTCNNSFRQRLRDLGYVERQNILLGERSAKSKPDRLHELAGELAQLKPDIIWTHSPPSVLAAKQATTTIPIVGITPVLQYSDSKAATKCSRATSICGFSSQYSKIPPRAGNVI